MELMGWGSKRKEPHQVMNEMNAERDGNGLLEWILGLEEEEMSERQNGLEIY